MTVGAVHPLWRRLREGSEPERCPPSRPSAHLRQHGPGARRDGADHRPAARTPRSGNDPEIHPSVRRHGARGGRHRRCGPGRGLSDGREEAASDRRQRREAGAGGPRVHGLGYAPCGARRAGPALRQPELRVSPMERRRHAQDRSRVRGLDGRGAGARQVSCPGDRGAVRADEARSGSDLRGLLRGPR